MEVTPMQTSKDSRTGAGLLYTTIQKKFRLRPFQERFMERVLSPDIRRAILCLSRGQGKSTLGGYIVAESVRPGGSLFRAGDENVLLSGSFDQSRYVYRAAKSMLPEYGYRFQDNKQCVQITHELTGTKLIVKSSRARGAFGIVGARVAIADEPGSWDSVNGELMADALDGAIGKPESNLIVIYIGTLAPGSANGWWRQLVEAGSSGSTYVQSLQGDPEKWDRWCEIRRCNPLMARFPESRKTLLEERDAARRDMRLKARYLSYRLNCPTQDETRILLSVDEYKRVLDREVPPRYGRPHAAVDLGAGRAFSAGCLVYPSGRTEALAICPGEPSIEAQEKRDGAPTGTYQRLVADGVLTTDGGLRVPRVKTLVDKLLALRPRSITCDRFRYSELLDAVGGRCRVEPRGQRWSEASADIRSLRQMALDGPLSVVEKSRNLIAASLSASKVESDDQGSLRLVKSSSTNTGRDDVCVAWAMVCGAISRVPVRRGGLTRSCIA